MNLKIVGLLNLAWFPLLFLLFILLLSRKSSRKRITDPLIITILLCALFSKFFFVILNAFALAVSVVLSVAKVISGG